MLCCSGYLVADIGPSSLDGTWSGGLVVGLLAIERQARPAWPDQVSSLYCVSLRSPCIGASCHVAPRALFWCLSCGVGVSLALSLPAQVGATAVVRP